MLRARVRARPDAMAGSNHHKEMLSHRGKGIPGERPSKSSSKSWNKSSWLHCSAVPGLKSKLTST